MKHEPEAENLVVRSFAPVLGLAFVAILAAAAIQFQLGMEEEAFASPLAMLQLVFFASLLTALLFPCAAAGKVIRGAAAAVFSVLVVDGALDLHDRIGAPDLPVDLTAAALWLAGGLMLWRIVVRREGGRPALAPVVAGLTLQAALAIVDLADGALFGPIDGDVANGLDLIESGGAALSLLLYAAALILSAVGEDGGSLAPAWARRAAAALFKAEFSHIGAAASIAYNTAEHRLWRVFNRGKSFGDFYAWQISRRLDRGRAHRTLGKRRFSQDALIGQVPEHDAKSFAERRPDWLIGRLTDLGLTPRDTVVDYGCGSLRAGQHLIAMLDRRRYWGLDVTDRFFSDGLSMLAPNLLQQKQPRCRVISPEALEEIRRHAPAFVVSVSVLKHVPPSELDGFFDGVCGLMGPDAKLAITFTEADREMRTAGKSWSYRAETIAGLIHDRSPDLAIACELLHPEEVRRGVQLSKCLITATPGAASRTDTEGMTRCARKP